METSGIDGAHSVRMFHAKLACVNCMMEDFYSFPRNTEIHPYHWEDDEEVLSYTEYDGQPFKLRCKNCGLQCMAGNEFWSAKELNELRQSDRGSTPSSAS